MTFNTAEIELVEQSDRKVFFKHLNGRLEPTGTVKFTFHAVTEQEILREFDRFWRPFWLRDNRSEQFCDETWHAFSCKLESSNLPKIPSIPIDTTDVMKWMTLIRKLPSNKAIGPCGWSNEELRSLREVCIQDLVTVFNMILDRGFTPSMMMAKTILLSKKDCPQSMHDARPITILSCLYRLFGRMVFKAVSRTRSRYLPASVSGGLPGRGVKEIAYIQKREIEDVLSSRSTCGGFSLDLIKAFNTFGRFSAARIMNHLGVPTVVTDTWINSLDNLVRFPTLNSVVAAGIPSTTGVPEGCSISVLAMLATSSMYYYSLYTPKINPFAYADNWSWLTNDQRAHLSAFRDVEVLTDVLRLQIDRSKSWHWGTTKEFRKFCVEQCSTPNAPAVVKTMVKDLGEIVHYNKSVSLGFIKEKIQEAIVRAHRIENLPCPLQQKALMIQTSVFPMAFYSADTTYIGQHHFTSMRKAISQALVGNWHNASALLACASMSKFLQDPFAFVLIHCSRTLRRLSNVNSEVAQSAIRFAVQYEGSRPYGPASVFRCYLNHVGRELQVDGTVTGPELLSFNVLLDSTKFIKNCILAMWNCHLVNIMTRKGVGDFYVDLQLSTRMFSTFSEEDQLLLRLNMVGGFQTQQQKALWDENIVPTWSLCVDNLIPGSIDCFLVSLLSLYDVPTLKPAISCVIRARNGFIYPCLVCLATLPF